MPTPGCPSLPASLLVESSVMPYSLGHGAEFIEELLRKFGQTQGVPESHRERLSCVAVKQRLFFPCVPEWHHCSGVGPASQHQPGVWHWYLSCRPCPASLSQSPTWAHDADFLGGLLKKSTETQKVTDTQRERLNCVVLE